MYSDLQAAKILNPVRQNRVLRTMEVIQTEEKTKARREMTKEAIALAMEGRWEEAVRVNQEILRLFRREVEALNRLGKAFLELGRHGEAQKAFQDALDISPHNIIAKKNLNRLARLQEQTPQPRSAKKVMPYRFIAESGRSLVTLLTRVTSREVVAHTTPGEVISLHAEDHTLTVKALQGEYLGQVEPRLALRLIRLMNGGNRYEGAVVSVKPEEVAVLLVEVYRDPSQAGISSFPAKDYSAQFKDAVLQYDLESEEDGDGADTVVEWQEYGNDSIELGEVSAELEPS